jgi:hypothetical protein
MPDSANTKPVRRGELQVSRFTGEEITSSRIRRTAAIIEAGFKNWPPFEIGVPITDHLRWKLEYPGWAQNRLKIATVDGVEAYVGLSIHRVFSIHGISYHARDWQDACVHPDFQKQGLYSRVQEESLTIARDYDFGFWSTINPHVMNTEDKYRPQYIDLGSSLKAFIRAVAPSDELARRHLPAARSVLRRRVLSAAISAARIFRTVHWSAPPVNDRLDIRLIEDTGEIQEHFHSLLQEIPRPSGLFQERGQEYIRWRYCDVRGGKSIIFIAFENGEPIGAAVCKMSKGIGSLIDLVTDPVRQDVASELIAAVDDHLERKGAAAIVCRTTAEAPLRKTLRTHGYIPAPLQTGCFISPAQLSLKELHTLLGGRSHHLMMGDFDWA